TLAGGGQAGDGAYLYAAAGGTHSFSTDPATFSCVLDGNVVATGITVAVGIGTANGDDTAVLKGQGAAGVNFYAGGTFPEAGTNRTVPFAYFSGPSFLSYVVDFRKTTGMAVAGPGTNSAGLVGGATGDNTFDSDGGTARYSGPGYDNTAVGFPLV